MLFLLAVSFTAYLMTVDSAAAQGVPVLLTFDDVALGSPVHTFPGLTLETFNSSNSDGSPHFTIVAPLLGTVSGAQALQSRFDGGAEFSGTHMTMVFDILQSHVTLSTGVVNSAPAGPGWAYLLEGFLSNPNAAGVLPIAQVISPCLGKNATPINTPLDLIDAGTRIKYALLSLVACDQPTNRNSGAVNDILMIDNLVYDRELNPPPHEANPPIVTMIDPTNGSNLVGAVSGEIAYRVRASVDEADLASVSISVNGGPEEPMAFFPNEPNTASAGVYLTANDGLVAGQNTVVVTARDYDKPPNIGSASATFNFAPKPPPSPTVVDIWPVAFDVTQTIDTGPHFLGQNFGTLRGYEVNVQTLSDVPLIKGKQTLIRVFGGASGTVVPLTDVPARMDVEKANCQANCIVASGVAPMQGWLSPGIQKPNPKGITVFPLGTSASDPNTTKTVLGNTWNFLLPASWTQDDLVVTIRINNGSYAAVPAQPKSPECSAPVAGECFNNNEVTLRLHFQQSAYLYVNPVFVHVTGNLQGRAYNDVQPTQAQFDTIIQQLNELYPMDVRVGARKDITVSASISNDDLLDRIDDATGLQACYAIASTPNVWLGIFPNSGAIPPTVFGPNANGVLGTANVGAEPCAVPAAWSNADDPTDAAHEIGHVIGFDHWGCEHQGDEECKDFPIAHGGTGGVPIDINAFTVVPLDTSVTPFHTHDFMVSHVNPPRPWVSWYTYQIMMNHSWFATYDADDPPAWIVSGTILSNGQVAFKPIYEVNVPGPPTETIVEDDAEDIWTTRGYDARGNVVLIHNFEPEKRDIHDRDSRRWAFTEPLPIAAGLTRIAVYKAARLLGELRAPTASFTGNVTVLEPREGARWTGTAPRTVRWTVSAAPQARVRAMISYSPDGGKTRQILRRGITGSQLVVYPSELAGSKYAIIYVQLSDGFRTTEGRSAAFLVDAKPPSVHIVTPRTQSLAYVGMPISLYGDAYDRQETLEEDQFRWTSDLDGIIGIGRQVSVSRLRLGTHRIMLTVNNHSRLRGMDAVHVVVVPYRQTN